MAKIKIKNSVTAGSVPSGLSFGEMAVNITDRKIFIGNAVEGVVTLHDQQNVVTSINGSTGAVSNIAVTNAAQTFSGLQTFSTGVSAAAIYAATVGGDEGGQVDFGNPVTNTSLTGGVAIDIYQNKMRFFEKGGSARGYYIDISAGGAGVGTDLVGGGGSVTSVSGSGGGILVSPTTGAVVVSNTGVHSVNGSTGAVTITTGLSWSAVTADRSLVAEEGVFANKSSGTLTLTLPTTAALGKVIRVSGMQNTWRIAQNASQKIHFGKVTTTTGAGGYLENSNAKDAVELVCCVANLEWNVISSIGNIVIV